MKESDAVTKWCPYSSFIMMGQAAPATQSGTTTTTPPIQRMAGKALDPNTLCLGKACIMWRETLAPTESDDQAEYGYCGFAFGAT